MSDFDWHSFFLNEAPENARTARHPKSAFSIFDTPEEVAKKQEKEPKKEPKKEAPPKPEPKSIFDAPQKDEEPSDGKWEEFLNLFYEGGKKKVKNPNPDTKDQYPEVQVSTALKDKTFGGKIRKEYEAWLQGGEEKKPEKSPLAELKPGDTFYEKGHEDEPLTVKKVITMPSGNTYLVVDQPGTDDLWYHPEEIAMDEDGKVKKTKPKEKEKEKEEEKPKPEVGTKVESLDDIVPGIFIENDTGVYGKVTSMLPDGGFRYQEYDQVHSKWKPAKEISKDLAEQYFSTQSFKVADDPVKSIPEGASVVEGEDVTPGDMVWVDGERKKVQKVEDDEDYHGHKFLLDDGEWVNMHKVDKPKLPGAHSYLYSEEGEPAPLYATGEKVYTPAGDEVKVLTSKKHPGGFYQAQVEMPDGTLKWVDEFGLSKEKPVPDKASVGDDVTKPSQLEEGDFIKSTAESKDDPYIGKVTEVHGDDQPLGAGVYVQDYNASTGKLSGKPWWLSAEDLDDGATTKIEPPKVKKGLVGKEVKDLKKLKPGDVLRAHRYEDGTVVTGVVVDVKEGKGVSVNIHNPKTGKLLGSRFLLFDGWEDKHQLSRLPASKVPKKLKPVKEKIEEGLVDPFALIMQEDAEAKADKEKADEEKPAEAPPEKKTEKTPKKKPKKIETPGAGDELKSTEDAKIDDALVWTTSDGETLRGIVNKKDSEGSFYVMAVDDEGHPKKYYIFDDDDLKGLQVRRTKKDDVPALKKAKIPKKPTEPVHSSPPEAPKGKATSNPKDYKDGDVVTWTFHGNNKPYRGKVVGHDGDGNPKIQVTWPSSSANHGKILDAFGADLLAKNKAHRVAAGDEEKYAAEAKEHEETVAKANAKFAADQKAYLEATALAQGKYTSPEHASSRSSFSEISAPSHWNPNSKMGRMADRLTRKYQKELGPEMKKAFKKGKSPKKAPARFGSQAAWDELTEPERRLWGLVHSSARSSEVASLFEKNLTPQEKSALSNSLGSGGWQTSSGGSNAGRIMGAMGELGLKGGPKSSSEAHSARVAGAQDEDLKNALAKALAFSQAFYNVNGITHLTVYRGLSSDALSYAKTGDTVEIPDSRELSSASIDPSTAYGFGSKQIKVRVPVAQVALSPLVHSSLCCYSHSEQAEFLLSDVPALTAKVMPNSLHQYESEAHKLKMAKSKHYVVSESAEDADWMHNVHRRKTYEQKDANKKAAVLVLREALQNPTLRRALASALFEGLPSTPGEKPPQEKKPLVVSEKPVVPPFSEWFMHAYQGGKKRVPNPNPETREQFPEVAVSTAMKDARFAQSVYDAYRKQTGKNADPREVLEFQRKFKYGRRTARERHVKRAVSIFDAPAAVERTPTPPPGAGSEPGGHETGADSSFEEWYAHRYDGGKRKVPNPNPKTKQRYPEVAASTAMKDKQFAAKVYAEYRHEKRQQEAEAEPPTPEAKEPEVLDIDGGDFKQIGPQTGSNPGGLYESSDGTRYYVKTPKNEDRARNEILAAKLYELADVDMPDLTPATRDGKFSVASKIIPGLSEDAHALRSGKVPGVIEGIAADAWLSNWDVIGLDYDNLLVDKEGRGRRVDTGGALRYRAMGAPKGNAFGDEVSEFKFFFDPHSRSGSVFKHATPEQIGESIDRVLDIPEDKIEELVEEWGPTTGGDSEDLLKTLLARRKWLADNKKDLMSKAKNKNASLAGGRAAADKKDDSGGKPPEKPTHHVVSEKPKGTRSDDSHYIVSETPEDADWFKHVDPKKIERSRKGPDDTPKSEKEKHPRDEGGKFVKKKKAHELLKLAKDNPELKAALVGEMRRIRGPRDFAVDHESQQVLLAHLQAGDLVRFAFRPAEGAPAVEELHAVLFAYDPATRGVELSSKGSGREMLEDRGDKGVVYVPSKGPARPLLKLVHVRSAI